MSNELSHAYIIRGGTSKSVIALRLLSEMLCAAADNRPCGICSHCDKAARGIHPDIALIAPREGKREIVVDQIREAVFDAAVSPNEANVRVIVVECAATMNRNAQNALLKLLEDPPRHVKLVLITDEPGALLSTVRSRCRLIDSGEAATAVPDNIAALTETYFSAISRGLTAITELSFELENLDRNDFALLLTDIQRRAATLLRAGVTDGYTVPQSVLMQVIETSRRAEQLFAQKVSLMHISALLCALNIA